MTTIKHTLIAVALGGTLFGAASDAAAEERSGRRTNDLADQVAVRHRRLLVKNRFEFTPLFESTINADFRHILGGGAKLEYHFSDMLSVGVVGVGSIALDTGLVKKIVPTLEMTTNDMTREPSQQEFQSRLNEMPLHGAAYIGITPWYGKLAAFSQAYVAFDFYFQVGVSFAQLKSSCPATVCTDAVNPDDESDNNPNNDLPLNSGGRAGLYLGGGIHVFLNDFIALDLTIRDYAFSDNPSGADFNANLRVTSDDSRFLHHLFFGAGLSIMFPTKVKRTN